MKPLEERISTHLAAWGNNGEGRGGMEQMTTESLHNHMINKEVDSLYAMQNRATESSIIILYSLLQPFNVL